MARPRPDVRHGERHGVGGLHTHVSWHVTRVTGQAHLEVDGLEGLHDAGVELVHHLVTVQYSTAQCSAVQYRANITENVHSTIICYVDVRW